MESIATILFLSQIADSLSSADMRVLRLFALKTHTKMTREAFAMLPFALSDSNGMLAFEESEEEIRSRAAFLSGLDPSLYHCCVNSCCCFVGPHETLQSCPYCGEARLNSAGHPRKIFTYVPIGSRLKAMYQDSETAKKLRYRTTFTPSPPLHTPALSTCSRFHQQTGLGLNNVCYCPSKINDIFDCQQYRALQDTPVTIGGKPHPFRFFASEGDIALGLLTDGFAPFKRSRQTCWPLLLINFNMPPEERFRKDNLICVGVIPEPKKPHDPDLFMWPMIEELLSLMIGVPTLNAYTKLMFALHVFLILYGGDIPAMSMIMNMKGHNGFSPCRMCKIQGVSTPNSSSKVYYCPLDRTHHPNILNGTHYPAQYDPYNLPLRTHTEFLAQAHGVQQSRTHVLEKALSKEYGIKGVSILSSLRSLAFPTSFPYDFMHLIYENLIPNLVLLWTGEFKGLDEGSENYQLDNTVWDAIGKATADSGSTIPSVYGPRVPNVKDERSFFTADKWSFWALYLAPVLLQRKFKHEKYYNHFIKLVLLLRLCLGFEFSSSTISEIRAGFIDWVENYERYVTPDIATPCH